MTTLSRYGLASLLLVTLTARAVSGRADRIILSPQGDTLAPNRLKTEFLLSPYRENENRLWMRFSSPVGIELEGERIEAAESAKQRYALHIQYPILPEFGVAPALSVGARDLFAAGIERFALYIALGKSLRLSDRQARIWREIRVHTGFGTGRMDGLFGGIQLRLRSGLLLSAEIYRLRPNVGLSLPLLRALQANVTSLDGSVSYGLGYQISW